MKRVIQDEVEFFFLEGPHIHPRTGKMWFETTWEMEDIGKDHNRIPIEDMERTLDYLEGFVREKQIDILLGFSQGGLVIDSFLRLRKEAVAELKFKGIILLSSYTFPDLASQLPPSELPLMFVGSESDEFVPLTLIPSGYSKTQVVLHDKGHKVPQTRLLVQSSLSTFFENLQT